MCLYDVYVLEHVHAFALMSAKMFALSLHGSLQHNPLISKAE